MAKKTIDKPDSEIVAISEVYSALKGLEQDALSRVLNYVAGKLKVPLGTYEAQAEQRREWLEPALAASPRESAAEIKREASEGLEGISPVAKKWMSRNGLDANRLSSIFSLGIDEIDLVAKAVPGKNKKARMHSVFLLKGIAAYLGTGAARFSHEQMKEACLHYDAFDAANFAANIAALSSEISGNKEAGYTLTARGLSTATDMVKELTNQGKAT